MNSFINMFNDMTKTLLFIGTQLLALSLLTSCLSGNDFENEFPSGPGGNGNGGWGGSSSYSSFSTVDMTGTQGSITDITTFDITLDESTLSETEAVPSASDDTNYQDDLFSDGDFAKTVTITFAEGSVTHTDIDGVEFTQQGAHLIAQSTKKVNFVLTGTSSDASFKLYSENKSQITLQNLALTNPNGAAINLQTRKRCFVYCPSGSSSTLSDGTTYATQYSTSTLAEPLVAQGEAEDQKGVLFSEGQLIFSGDGLLSINANGKNGIATDQYLRTHAGCRITVKVATTASNGIKCDKLLVNGGVINVENLSDGGKGINVQGRVTISGGRTTLITSGSAVQSTNNGSTSVTSPCGLKADSLFTLNGGALYCKSTGTGGKGLSTDMDCLINGGTLACIASGSSYGNLSSGGFGGPWGGGGNSSSSGTTSRAKAFKVDGNITVTGGSVKVRCCTSNTSGDEGHEGIETKGTFTISGGDVASFSYDDAINSAKKFTMTGGRIFAYSINNDGLDSNAAMSITGGQVVAIGTNAPECGIDTVEGTSCAISGGYMMAFSSGTMTQSFSASNGNVGKANCSIEAGQLIKLSSGSKAFYFVAPRAMSCLMQYYLEGESSPSVSNEAFSTTPALSGSAYYNMGVAK